MAQQTAIAERNDKFRVNVINSPSETQGKCVLTAGIANQYPLVLAHILYAVKNFSDFKEEDNPYGENDFGAFEICKVKMYFKIDYYLDESMNYGTDDPLTSYQVLTIMLASEY